MQYPLFVCVSEIWSYNIHRFLNFTTLKSNFLSKFLYIFPGNTERFSIRIVRQTNPLCRKQAKRCWAASLWGEINPPVPRTSEAACPAIASATAEAALQEGVLALHAFGMANKSPRAASELAKLSRTTGRGALHPLFLTAPPYPHSCDQSPVKNRPVRITGELFPGDTKERSVK